MRIRYWKKLLLIITLFVGLVHVQGVQNTHGQSPTLITPTIYCVGGAGVPPCAPIDASPTTGPTIPMTGAPSTTVSPAVSANPTSGSSVPSPTTDPCSEQQNSIQHDKGKKKKKFKGGGSGGFIEMFMKFFMWLIEYILKGGNVPPPTTGPEPTSGVEPTDEPEPTTNPCPEPTAEPLPSSDPEPTTAQPSTGPSASAVPTIGTQSTKRNIPIAPEGSLGQFNLSSKDYIMAFRFILDAPQTIDRWYFAINGEGATCIGGRTGYGSGNGGIHYGRIVEVNQTTGMPTTTVLAEEKVNGCTAHQRSITEFGLTKTHQAHFIQFAPVQLQAGKMYAFLLSNTDPSPGSGGSAASGNHMSPNLNFAKLTDMGPHGKNTLDANAAGAMYGYDPRETTMWSKDSGATWLFGDQVGWYQNGSGEGRMWIVGYRAGGKNIPHGYTYMNWPDSSTGASITYKNVPKAVTLTQAGGASEGSVGVVTVTNTTTGVSATTPSLGSGVATGQLSQPVPVAVGQSYTIKASGSVETGSASFWDKIFGLGTNYASSCAQCSKPSDMPALFALPHPY